MCYKSALLCLIVVAGTWAKPADEGDLNLKSIFRTPKDFSKANLDHFEILERSNFEDKEDDAAKITTRNAEHSKAEDKASKCMANAQVMLRIGGEDIHDCNRVMLPTQSPLKENIFFTPEQQQQQQQQMMYNNDARYPYNPPQPYGVFPCFAQQQPYSFPGYYFNPSPVQNYLPSYQSINNPVVQTDLVPKPGDTLTTIETSTGRGEECSEQTRNQQMVVESHNPCDNQMQRVEMVQEQQSNPSEPKLCVSNPISQTQVVDNCGCNPTQEIHHVSDCGEATSRPEPLSSKVEYVEVNLADVEKNCQCNPREENSGTLVTVSTQKSSRENPVLVSYPTSSEEKTTCSSPQQEIVVSECPRCTSSSLCDSCSQERNPNTPFGDRFSKDVDSLFKIVDNGHSCGQGQGETIINIHSGQAPRKLETISTVVSSPSNAQQEYSVQNIVSHPSSQTQVVEIINPCQETREVIQESSPCSKTITIESPCTTKTVTELKREPSVTDSQIEWSTQTVSTEPCQHREVVTSNTCSNVLESPTETQVVQVTNNPSNAHRDDPPLCQPEWSVKKIYTNPSPQREVVHTFTPWPQHPTPPEMVQVNPARVEVAETPCAAEEMNAQRPMVYVSEYDSNSDRQVSVDITKYQNERPKVQVESYRASSGHGHHSNPLRSVYFKRPSVVESIKLCNSQSPVMEHTKYVDQEKMVWDDSHRDIDDSRRDIDDSHRVIDGSHHIPFKFIHPWSSVVETIKIPSQPKQHTTVLTNWAPHHKTSEPHLYKVVPKYDIIPRGDIKTLNIPDLVPTNQFLKINTLCPEKSVSHKKFLAVEKIPILKNEWFLRTWPFWRNVSVQREMPWLPSDFSLCGACAKYKGELEELS